MNTQYSPYYLPLNVFAASERSNLYILFAITAPGVVSCGGPKKSPRTSSIVQIIFLFRFFEISKDIQSVQTLPLRNIRTCKQCLNYLTPFRNPV